MRAAVCRESTGSDDGSTAGRAHDTVRARLRRLADEEMQDHQRSGAARAVRAASIETVRWRRSVMPGTEPPIRPNRTASQTAISHQLFHAENTKPITTTRIA